MTEYDLRFNALDLALRYTAQTENANHEAVIKRAHGYFTFLSAVIFVTPQPTATQVQTARE